MNTMAMAQDILKGIFSPHARTGTGSPETTR